MAALAVDSMAGDDPGREADVRNESWTRCHLSGVSHKFDVSKTRESVNPAISVFVCSTFSDLSEERESVLDAIRRLQLQHDSMEFFGARTGQPIETCLEEVRSSNILVVIVGHRYGTLVPELGVSFSEAEYIEGHKFDKPCLVYMRDENVPILPRFMERDPDKLELLEQWKATLQKRHTVATFKESRDLAVQIAADLGRTTSELEETARAREEARLASSVPLLDEVGQLVKEAVKGGVTEQVLLSSIRHAVSDVISEVQNLGPTIIFSHASADSEIVQLVAKGLSITGLRVWSDKETIVVGDEWVREIERELDSADFIIFFISSNSVQSEWNQRELQIALHRQVSGERGSVLLPVLLEPVEVPPLLRQFQIIDMSDGDIDRAVMQLADAVRFHRRRKSVVATDQKKVRGKKISADKIIAILEEERGIVGSAAKRLGMTPKRLYQLLNHYNIQARQFR